MHKQSIIIWADSFINIEYSQRKKKCFKNVSNPSCIDLFLTNSALSLQHTLTVSCELSDFNKLVYMKY